MKSDDIGKIKGPGDIKNIQKPITDVSDVSNVVKENVVKENETVNPFGTTEVDLSKEALKQPVKTEHTEMDLVNGVISKTKETPKKETSPKILAQEAFFAHEKEVMTMYVNIIKHDQEMREIVKGIAPANLTDLESAKIMLENIRSSATGLP